MIKQIIMKNVASYDQKGIELADCKRINFIYGTNGAGKTTLSNYLGSLKDLPEKYRECYVDHDGKEILVYNRKFREEQLKRESIGGLFSLGKQDVELSTLKDQIQELEIKTSMLENQNIAFEKELDARGASINAMILSDIQQPQNAFLKPVFEQYMAGNDLINELIKKLTLIMNNSKDIPEFPDQEEKVLKEVKGFLVDRPPQEYPIWDSDEYCPEILGEIEDIIQSEIWGKSIVGNQDIDIEGLISILGNEQWVNQGRKYIQLPNNKCPFCQQETDLELLKNKFDLYFNGKYEENIALIQRLAKDYKGKSNTIIEEYNRIYNEFRDYEYFDFEVGDFLQVIFDLQNITKRNIKKIKEKLEEPNKRIELDTLEDMMMKVCEVFESINQQILSHNNSIASYHKGKEQAIENVWQFYIGKYEKEILDYYLYFIKSNNDYKERVIDIEIHKQKIENCKQRIVEIENNYVSIQPVVDRINKMLKAYGFRNFKIQRSSNELYSVYQLVRLDGTVVEDTLSEGEETFISFLYYLELVNEPIQDHKKRVLVIDDPISSLDSYILHVVATAIRLIIQTSKNNGDPYHPTVEQVFLLTHNSYFYKEVSNVKNLSEKNTRYYILHKDELYTTCDTYTKNPISSTYSLMWQEIKRHKENPTLESFNSIQNNMRRIIENYFTFTNRYDTIEDCFESDYDKIIYRSLIGWLNDGSHSILDEYELPPDLSAITKYFEVFEKVFKVTGNEAHYIMMMNQ